MLILISYVFFFKQKTAYEMRISDWSSFVCSSDLGRCEFLAVERQTRASAAVKAVHQRRDHVSIDSKEGRSFQGMQPVNAQAHEIGNEQAPVGKTVNRNCLSGYARLHAGHRLQDRANSARHPLADPVHAGQHDRSLRFRLAELKRLYVFHKLIVPCGLWPAPAH